jgi:hypothetical protein
LNTALEVSVEPVSIVTEKNVADFIQYMLRHNRQYSEKFFSGILRAAIIQFMAFQGNNIRHSAAILTTFSIAQACCDGANKRTLEERWR